MSNELIINSPSLQSLRLKFTSTLLTLCFWVIWFYLWIPLVTLTGWLLQVEFFHHQMFVLEGTDSFFESLPFLLGSIVGLTSALLLWAFYNFTRFKGEDRRQALPIVKNADLLQTFPISEEILKLIQTNKVSTISLSEGDKITLHT